MKRTLSLIAALSVFSSAMALAANGSSCMMNVQEQREMILNESSAALSGKSGSDCFERLVTAQTQMLKKAGSSTASSRTAVIEDLKASAIKGLVFESSNPE